MKTKTTSLSIMAAYSRYLFWIFCLNIFPLNTVLGRNHTLKLPDEVRNKFAVSTFGFYVGGTLCVSMDLEFEARNLKEKNKTTFGFTLDKTSTNEALSAYFEDKDKKCALRKSGDDILGSDHSVSVVTMKVNLNRKVLTIKRFGDDISTLLVQPEADCALASSALNSTSGNTSSKNVTITSTPVPSRKTTKNSSTISPSEHESTTTQNTSAAPSSTNKLSSKGARSTDTEVGHLTRPIGVTVSRHLENEKVFLRIHTSFSVHIRDVSEEGLYNLYFHNCANNGSKTDIKLSLTMHINEKNPTSYLSAGEIPMPPMYFALAVLFFLTGCFWLHILRTSTDGVYKMHYLMLVLVYVKALSFMFHGINFHFIGVYGIHEAAWAVPYYITHLMKGSLLFLTIVLIGTGWTLIKHMLTERDKKIFLIVIPLQILANVAQIIIDETEEGDALYTTFRIVLFLVDLLCCAAIMFPVLWSINHLQEASQVDGKAAINLQKLKLFRQFYIMIVSYIYFTRIIVYLVQMVMTFMYNPWLNELLKELSTYVLFVVTGSKFRPASNNPYLQVPTEEEDDDIEMDEVLTKTGLTDTLIKVNQSHEQTTASTIKQRESSHEYD